MNYDEIFGGDEIDDDMKIVEGDLIYGGLSKGFAIGGVVLIIISIIMIIITTTIVDGSYTELSTPKQQTTIGLSVTAGVLLIGGIAMTIASGTFNSY